MHTWIGRCLVGALGALATLALAGTAMPAAGQVHFGPQVSLADDADVGLGGRVTAGVEGYSGLEVIGSFDVFFPDGDFDYWELNGNLVHNFELPEEPSVRPYAGGGLNVAHISFDDPGGDGPFDDDADETEVGLNLLGGFKFPMEGVTPFVEGRFEIEGGEQVVVTGGILFP